MTIDAIQPSERRQDRRIATSQPIKLQCCGLGRYYAGRTQNYSAGGALLQVDWPVRLLIGQQVRLGLGQDEKQVVVRSEDLIDATVVRHLAIGGRQQVAVQFRQRRPLQSSLRVPA